MMLRPANADLWYHQLQQLEGKEYELTIKEKYKKGTEDQFGYYFAGVLNTCYNTNEFSHFDKAQDIHDLFFAPKFLSFNKMVETKYEKFEVQITPRLSSMSKKEFSDFLEKVISWCGDNNILILTPQEYSLGKYKTYETNN